MVKKLVMKQVTTKEGKQFNHYYLVLENGNYIQIKPSFASDYSKLRLVAERVEE